MDKAITILQRMEVLQRELRALTLELELILERETHREQAHVHEHPKPKDVVPDIRLVLFKTRVKDTPPIAKVTYEKSGWLVVQVAERDQQISETVKKLLNEGQYYAMDFTLPVSTSVRYYAYFQQVKHG